MQSVMKRANQSMLKRFRHKDGMSEEIVIDIKDLCIIRGGSKGEMGGWRLLSMGMQSIEHAERV